MSQQHPHISELMASALETEKGPLGVQGFHALAGVEITKFPFTEKKPEQEPLERWRRRMTWFWKALAFGTRQTGNAWFTGFELRIKRHGEAHAGQKKNGPMRVSLWAKAVAPHAEQARYVAEGLAEMVQALLPAEFCAVRVRPEHFQDLWGVETPAWLGEVRPGIAATPKPEGDRSRPEGWELAIAHWHPTPETMFEPWGLLARLETPAWLSVGICPTKLFEPEKKIWSMWKQDRPKSSVFPGEEDYFFQVRVRVGGEENPARWLAQGLVSALHSPQDVLQPALVVPDQTQQNATFNWQWGDFQPWEESPLPVSLRRFRYLMDTDQMGVVAGIWL